MSSADSTLIHALRLRPIVAYTFKPKPNSKYLEERLLPGVSRSDDTTRWIAPHEGAGDPNYAAALEEAIHSSKYLVAKIVGLNPFAEAWRISSQEQGQRVIDETFNRWTSSPPKPSDLSVIYLAPQEFDHLASGPSRSRSHAGVLVSIGSTDRASLSLRTLPVVRPNREEHPTYLLSQAEITGHASRTTPELTREYFHNFAHAQTLREAISKSSIGDRSMVSFVMGRSYTRARLLEGLSELCQDRRYQPCFVNLVSASEFDEYAASAAESQRLYGMDSETVYGDSEDNWDGDTVV